jgi:PKD repeat protein
MKKITLLLLTALCLNHLWLFAQDDYLHCGSDQVLHTVLNSNPKLKEEYLKREAESMLRDKQAFATGYKLNGAKQMVPVYIIPIVFHIINQGGTENISDAQVKDAVRILNEDYRKLNANMANTVSQFQPIAADCEIEFRLAQLDPTGACTNGIDRITSALTNNADDNSKLNYWPRNKYLNVWSVKTIGSSGVAGYAYLPGTAFPYTADGVLILSEYIGSIGTGTPTRSHALTHEIGHFLNLNHTWGNTNNPGVDCSGNDNVSDTPPTEGWTTCNLSGATCGSPIDNVQNFMEYSYCSTMFTEGQKTRMRDALVSSTGQRNNLWTTTNLAATGVSLAEVLCHADFQSSNTYNTICQGNSLTFTDLSWNGLPTGWNWTFPGGTPSSSTDSAPTIIYNTPGTYDVSLTVTNGSGSASATKPNFINVNSSTATYNVAVYSESFEGAAIPNTDWQVRNQAPGGNTWVQTSAAATTGSHSVKITNAATYDTYVDELISPSINMTSISGSTKALRYKVAYAQRTSTSADKLQVYVSTNCGLSWVLRSTLTGAALSTGGVQTSSFTPTASQWAQKSVTLTSYANQTNLYIMFRFTSNGGNNIYLDDINIFDATTGIDEAAEALTNFNVYPNPADDNTNISFNLIDKQKVELKISDMLGRQLSSIVNSELNAGEYLYPITEKDKFSAGIYFVTLNIGQQQFTKKLIIK